MGGICPRCGREYAWIERRTLKRGGSVRTYLYAIHVYGKGKERRREACYLGPADQYEYVTRLHAREGLVLRNLLDQDRVIDYIESLASAIENIDPKAVGWERLLHLSEILKNLSTTLLEIAREEAPEGVEIPSTSIGQPNTCVGQVPSWEEFISMVKKRAEESDEDAQKLLKRIKKDAATVKRVLKLLSEIS